MILSLRWCYLLGSWKRWPGRFKVSQSATVVKWLILIRVHRPVLYLILLEVLFLIVLNRDITRLRRSVIVKVSKVHTWSRSCYLERLFLLKLLNKFWLLSSLVEESKIVLVFLLSPCVLSRFVCIFPLLLDCPRRWRFVVFRVHLFDILRRYLI